MPNRLAWLLTLASITSPLSTAAAQAVEPTATPEAAAESNPESDPAANPEPQSATAPVAQPASAEPLPTPTADSDGASKWQPSPFRPFVAAGFYEGLAAGVSIATEVGLRVSGGYLPLLVSVRRSRLFYDDEEDLELLHSAQLNADVVWMIAQPTPGSRIGLSLGYRYNTVMAHGFGAAFQGEARLSAGVSLGYTFGLMVFPDGPDRVREELGYLPMEVDFESPLFVSLQGGGGVSLNFDLH